MIRRWITAFSTSYRLWIRPLACNNSNNEEKFCDYGPKNRESEQEKNYGNLKIRLPSKNKNKKMMKNELMEKVQSGKFSSDDEILENV